MIRDNTGQKIHVLCHTQKPTGPQKNISLFSLLIRYHETELSWRLTAGLAHL